MNKKILKRIEFHLKNAQQRISLTEYALKCNDVKFARLDLKHAKRNLRTAKKLLKVKTN